MAARTSSRRQNHIVPGVPVNPGFVQEQVARYSPRQQAAMAAQGEPAAPKAAVVRATDRDGTPLVRKNGQPIYALLNPNPGTGQRDYVYAHTKKGSELRKMYPELYAPYIPNSPGFPATRRAAVGSSSRRTPTRNGQPIKIINPGATTPGDAISFGGSVYNATLKLAAGQLALGNNQLAQTLINELGRVDPQLANYVGNDLMNGRIGHYVLNPKTKHYIKVGTTTYNHELLGPNAAALANGQVVREADLKAARGQGTSGNRRRGFQSGIFIANPTTTRRSIIEVGGNTFNSLYENPATRDLVYQAARAAGASDAIINQGLAEGGRASARSSTRGRASASRAAPAMMAPVVLPQARAQVAQAQVAGAPNGLVLTSRNYNPAGGVNAAEVARLSPRLQAQAAAPNFFNVNNMAGAAEF